jgi:uncharacterized membrane protein YadS
VTATVPIRSGAAASLLPGLLLCLGLTVVARALQAGEEHLTGHSYVEALVLAILLGTALRTAWVPGARFKAGIAFSAKSASGRTCACWPGSAAA